MTGTRKLAALERRARAYINIGKLDEASVDVGEMVKLAPKSPITLGVRGRLYKQRGQLDLALNDYNEAVQLAVEPTSKSLYLSNRGFFYRTTGNHQAAIDDYTLAISLNPKNTLPLVGRALAYQQLSRDGEAFADLSKAIVIDGKFTPAWLERGDMYLRAKDAAKADADFAMALELEPGNKRAEQGRRTARTLLIASSTVTSPPGPQTTVPPPPVAPATPSAPATQPEPIAPVVQMAPAAPATPPKSDQKPAEKATNSTAEAAMAVALKEADNFRKAKEWAKAIAVYDKILAAQPKAWEVHLLKAVTVEESGESLEAFTLYTAILKADSPPPEKIIAIQNMTRIACQLDQFGPCESLATTWLKAKPDLADAHYWRGFARMNLGMFSLAVEDFKAVPANSNRGGAALARRAYSLVAGKQADEAAALAEQAIKVNPKLAIAYVARARIALVKGDLVAAEKDIATATQHDKGLKELTFVAQLVQIHKLFKSTDAPLAAR